MNWHYSKDKALVSFPAGTEKEVNIAPTVNRGRKNVGFSLAILGNLGLMVGSFGSGSVPWILGGAGGVGLGLNQVDRSYSYTNTMFHVIEKEQPTNVLPLGAANAECERSIKHATGLASGPQE